MKENKKHLEKLAEAGVSLVRPDSSTIDPDFYLYRLTSGSKRYYIKMDDDGTHVAPSVTTILNACSPLGYGLLQWYASLGYEEAQRYKQERADYGTLMHIAFSRILRGDVFNLGDQGIDGLIYDFATSPDCEGDYNAMRYDLKKWRDDIKKDLVGFVRWLKDYEVDPVAIEHPVWGGRYATVIDLVANLTVKKVRRRMVINYKSGRKGFYPEHEIQLAAEHLAWNRQHPEHSASGCANYSPSDYRLPIGKTVDPYKFKDQTNSKHAYKWRYYVAMFHRDPANKPKDRAEFRAIDLGMDTDTTKIVDAFDPITRFCELHEKGVTGVE